MSFAMEQTTLTVTQLHLGAPLQWQPLVGTAEHNRRVDAYIPGPAPLDAKRATIAVDFFQTVEATSMPYPFTRTYHVSIPVAQSPASAFSFDSFSISTPSSIAGAKRPRDSASPTATVSAPSKRLPGFSIMTRDGVDVTENQSRGPKTKEQREHAAKMRKLGACPSCKKRKQKCEPSHHRPSAGPAAPAMTASNSSNSSLPSLTASSLNAGSSASISPQSSIESAFTPPSVTAQPENTMVFDDSLVEFPDMSNDMFDDFLLHDNTNFYDFENAMAQPVADWSYAQPTVAQDFDLFSYDNTFDFDANLFSMAPTSHSRESPQSPIFPQYAFTGVVPTPVVVDSQVNGDTDGRNGGDTDVGVGRERLRMDSSWMQAAYIEQERDELTQLQGMLEESRRPVVKRSRKSLRSSFTAEFGIEGTATASRGEEVGPTWSGVDDISLVHPHRTLQDDHGSGGNASSTPHAAKVKAASRLSTRTPSAGTVDVVNALTESVGKKVKNDQNKPIKMPPSEVVTSPATQKSRVTNVSGVQPAAVVAQTSRIITTSAPQSAERPNLVSVEVHKRNSSHPTVAPSAPPSPAAVIAALADVAANLLQCVVLQAHVTRARDCGAPAVVEVQSLMTRPSVC